MTGQKRIAVVIPAHWSYSMGGSEYQAKLLVEALVRRYSVTVGYFAARVSDIRTFDNHTVFRTGSNHSLRRYGHFWDFFKLQRRLAEFQPDVIYQRVSCSYAGIAGLYARRTNTPMICHIASQKDCSPPPRLLPSLLRPHILVESRLAKYGLRHANSLIVQSEDQRALVRQNIGDKDVSLIRNFHPVPDDVADKSDTSFTVVWIANMKALKRPELFLEIAGKVSSQRDVEFVLVGQPYPEAAAQNALQDMIRKSSNVTYAGPIAQEAVGDLLARSHLLVNTSVFEGFPNTMIQAWMRRVPVVTMGVNPDSLLDDGKLGASCDTTDEVARYIERLNSDRTRLMKMGADARAFATKEFSMNNANRLADLVVESVGLSRKSATQ
jgi:glycosyltransferase involved in cell wall biosynthesis